MKFCATCENMLYTKILSKESEELVYYCRNCNTNEPYDHEDLCVSKVNFKRSEQKYHHSINEYTKLDPTLPRINNIPCPNVACESNRKKDPLKTEIIYLRYDDINMKYIYTCIHCDKVWKLDEL